MTRSPQPLRLLAAVLFAAVLTPADGREEANVGTSEQPITLAPSNRPAGQCRQGYVWREARPGDKVCVTPQTRAAVQEQNRQRAKLWTPGPYGPHTCLQGYVWREAFKGDDVCVRPEFREQTRRDNAEAARRVASR